jgi:hypothetical protein
MPTTQSKALVTNRLIILHVMTGGTADARKPPEVRSPYRQASAVAWRDAYKFATCLGRHLEADDNLGNLRFCDASILDAHAKSYNEDKHRYTLTALAKIRIIGLCDIMRSDGYPAEGFPTKGHPETYFKIVTDTIVHKATKALRVYVLSLGSSLLFVSFVSLSPLSRAVTIIRVRAASSEVDFGGR